MLLPYCYRPMRNVSGVVCASLGRGLASSARVSCSTVFTITIMSPVINVANIYISARARRPAGGGGTSHPAGTCAGWRVPRSCAGCSLELDMFACSHITSLVPRPLSTVQFKFSSCPRALHASCERLREGRDKCFKFTKSQNHV